MMASTKQQIHRGLHALASGADRADIYHEDARFWGSHPINERVGVEAIRGVWGDLRRALPDLERRDAIFVGGESAPDDRSPAEIAGRSLLASMGCYQGTFAADLWGIPATQGVVHLRACEVHHVVDAKIAHSYVLLDLLDLMRQAGVWPLAPSLGAEGMWPGPADSSGLRADASDPARGAEAMRTVLAMHTALGEFDGKSIESIRHERYWTENFLWYGPAGIGTTRGMRGFRAHHQIPFLIGFPDRKGAGHYVRVADGDYVVTGGWPSVVGTHLGEWLGLPPTGRQIEMRVMDFYRLEGERIAENWVPIDVIHILKQMGFDVFGRLAHRRGAARLELPR